MQVADMNDPGRLDIEVVDNKLEQVDNKEDDTKNIEAT